MDLHHLLQQDAGYDVSSDDINTTTLAAADDVALLSQLNNASAAATEGCRSWDEPQHIIYQVANIVLFIALLSPNTTRGLLIFHCLLIFVFLLYSTWAWNVICAPDVFPWYFSFMIVNMAQALYIVYRIRPVRFSKELEDVYQYLFQPLQVPRLLFKKLVDFEFAQVLTMQRGETYAMQDMTRADRLALLISGTANIVQQPRCVLHTVTSKQFLDSPEFESSSLGSEDKFQVSIVANTACRYLMWQRPNLEYLFTKEPYLATVMSFIIARDLANKLYALNSKIVTDTGSTVDIRLPPASPALSGMGEELHQKLTPVPSGGSTGPGKQTRKLSDKSDTDSVLVIEKITEETDESSKEGSENDEEQHEDKYEKGKKEEKEEEEKKGEEEEKQEVGEVEEEGEEEEKQEEWEVEEEEEGEEEESVFNSDDTTNEHKEGTAGHVV